MVSRLKWIGTFGGPHLLIAEEHLPFWRGSDGWRDHCDLQDQSHYARACRIESWIGEINCGGVIALVLSGDVGDVAWPPDRGRRGSPAAPKVSFLSQALTVFAPDFTKHLC